MTHSIDLPDNTVTLAAGSAMPLLGFGTWQIKGDDAVRATSAALEAPLTRALGHHSSRLTLS